MNEFIKKYLKSDFGDLEIPSAKDEKVKLAGSLFGLSLVNQLD